MRLNKTLEVTILKAYHEYWNAYLKGDMKTMSYWMHNNIQMIGSGRGEFFDNKKKTLQYYKSTSAQVAGKADMRNRKITVMPVGDEILVNEECDFFVLINSVWTFYGEGRISTLFTKTNKGWKIVQEHGSMPDARTAKGEQVNTNKIKAENVKLKEAVKRRTVELEEKNHELGIETALEKVRAVAMGMKKADDLLIICKTVYKELQKLGFTQIRNTLIAIFYDDESYLMDYDYSDFSGGNITSIPYHQNKIVDNHIKQMKTANDAFTEFVVKGKALQEWKDFRRQNREYEDTRLENINALYYYFYSINSGSIGISTFKKINEEQLAILKKFRNVFDLAYRRYVDITKAEAQALEARIETALERVRSRSMAMHQASELQEVIHVVHKELLHLKLSIDGGSFVVINDDIQTVLRCWGSGGTANTSEEVALPLYKKPFLTNLINEIKKGPRFFTEEFSKREKKDFFTFLFKHKPWSALSTKQKKETLSAPGGYTRSVAVSVYTSIFIINHQGKKFSDAENDILKRFAKVFEQTYTRFLDLKKAEAQTREAEIELALERVRAKTMAMQKSDELKETTLVLFQQFKALGATTAQVSICIFDEDIKTGEMFVTLKGEKIDKSFIMELDKEVYVIKKVKKYFLGKQKKFSFTYKGKELQKYNRWRNTLLEKKGWDESDAVLKQAWYVNGVIFSRGMMGISSDTAPTDEALKILERFGNVFDLTFTRFLDLQKAEAQAREVQIELALERVRARTMAMQKSDEMAETSFVLFQQFNELGHHPDQFTIGIINEADHVIEFWHTWLGNKMETKVNLSIDEPHVANKIYNAWKKQIKSGSIDLSGKELKEYNKYRKEKLTDAHVDLGISFLETEKRRIINFTCFSKGIISISTHQPVGNKTVKLLERFAKVFEQTYTRFLDLQKAEAQVREAQIEAALEKVRSSSLAMHRSDEMQGVVNMVIDQLQKLNIVLDTTNILIFNNEDKSIDFWTGSNSTGTQLTTSWKVPYFDILYYKKIWAVKESGQDLFSASYSFKEKNKLFTHLFANSDFKNLNVERKKFILKSPRATIVAAIVKDTAIQVISYSRESFDVEEIEILKRFSKVFNQAYTRFLDLQRAEAQAREAQIEAAMEKIRSRSLAMHHSNELKEVITVTFEKLKELNVLLGTVGIQLFDKESMNAVAWIGTSIQDPQMINLPYDKQLMQGTNFLKDTWQAMKDGKNLINKEYSLAQKNKYFNHLFANNDLTQIPQQARDFLLQMKRHLVCFFPNKNSSFLVDSFNEEVFSNESINVISRAAKVFEQAYIRFLDLQRAETQAREAQIEAALERVRSKAMAMHKSDDIAMTSAAAFEELKKLGIHSIRCGVGLFTKDSKIAEVYAATQTDDDKIITLVKNRNMDEHPALVKQLESWKKQQDHEQVLKGEELKSYYNKSFFQTSGVKASSSYKNQAEYGYYFAFGDGLFYSWSVEPYTNDEKETLNRFRSIIALTFRRFLDLQKAEAQARESQIQLALERVRARSLAMHHTSELQEVVNIAAQQLHEMSIDINGGVFIAINDEVDHDIPLWSSSGVADYTQKVIGPFLDKTIFSRMRDAIKKRNNFLTEEYSREEKLEFFHHLFNHAPWNTVPEERKKEMLSREGGYTRSIAIAQHTSIAITNHNGKKFTDEDNEILKRFSNVFEQSYIRFLDLQKAEAQAREAQIEAALERVRSATMAMHKTEEFIEVISVVFKQLQNLNFKIDSISLSLDYKENPFKFWMAIPEQPYPAEITVPYADITMMNYFIRETKNSTGLIKAAFNKAEKDEWIQHVIQQTIIMNASDERKKFMFEAPGLVISVATVKSIALLISNYSEVYYTDEENEILKRFANVFNQSYTRFLDLQKAEAQAREAQIEAALERVRSKTMAMHNSNDMAETVTVMFTELQKLGIETIRCGIGIMQDNYRMEVWTAKSDVDGKAGLVIGSLNMKMHPLLKGNYDEWKLKNDSFSYDLHDEDLVNYYTILTNDPDYPINFDISSLPAETYHNSFFFPEGSLYVFSKKQLHAETKKIFKRFAAIFGQTYRRYLDLQKAEAQAREAQIQLALERVRARTMAMQKSDELSETVYILFQQFRELGENPDQTTIGVINEAEKVIDYWVTMYGNLINKVFKFPFDEPNVTNKIYNAWKENKKSLIIDLSGKELLEFMAYRESKGGAAVNPNEKRRIISGAFFSKGVLIVQSTAGRSEESIKLLERFAVVFEQTYTRFLDLQQVEAQAREAQIEAALERVRSRSMAMHKSDELKEVIRLVLEQFVHLKINAAHAGFYIDYKAQDDMHIWLADPNLEPFFAVLPYFDTPTWNSFLDAKAKGTALHTDLLDFEEKNKFYNSLFKLFTVPEEAKQFYMQCKGLAVSTVLLDSVGLYIENFEGKPYSEEENKVLLRFGKVFQQTYTRFLDLQKAEAQAREAQIQLALERVRARTMAMQHSDELRYVVHTFFERLNDLEIQLHTVFLIIFTEGSKDTEWWLMNNRLQEYSKVKVEYNEQKYFHALIDAREKGEEFFSMFMPYEEKNELLSYLFEHTGFIFTPEEQKKRLLNMECGSFSVALTKYFAIHLTRYSAKIFSEEENNILKRFTKVFDQSYTRFLDLQKAEAQARESQIQLALERVRARTMAMQSSVELPEVATILFQQVKSLGISQWVCGFFIFEIDDKEATWYQGSPDGEILDPCKVPLTEHPVFISMNESRKRGDELFVYEKEGELQADHYRYMKTIPGMKKLLQGKLDAGLSIPAFQIDHLANFSHGSLIFITYEHFPEMHDVFKRFAKAFDQTYTRFLDLQKAEAQAREGQIQLALERVRARTMAMQHSDELLPTAEIMFDQLKLLGAELQGVAFAICDKNSKMVQKWTSIGNFSHPYDIEPGEQRMYEAWKNQSGMYEEVYEGEKQKKYYEKFMEIPEFRKGLQKIIDLGIPIPAWQKNYAVPFKNGYVLFIITKPFNETQIFLRFGNVFEQTYTRFLDLEKAEAQAREAQIEAALERVRSKTMAMHNSADVSEATATMFTQLENLGIDNFRGGITILKTDRTQEVWSVTNLAEGKSVKAVGVFHIDDHPFWKLIYDAWLNKEEFQPYYLSGEEKEKYIGIINKTPNYISQPIKEFPDVYFQGYFFGPGAVWTNSFQLHTNEQQQILKRFASVFALTFRRYQDLQKAEKQAREAKIEAALEKVRARALAMQKADELILVAEVLRKEMGLLGVEELETSSIYIHNEATGKTECWYAIKNEQKLVSDHMTIDLNDTWVGRQMMEYYRSDKKQVSIRMQGNNRKEWINYCSEKSKALSGFYGSDIPDRTYHLFKFSNGYMGAASPGDISAESWDLLQRATAVFSLAYTRFNDLQIAEANTREAVKQAALDRIRADIASMRTTKDLEKITPLIWNELTILGIPFIRCGVFIMDDAQQLIHTFLSTPDGKAITAFHLPFSTPGNISYVLQNWRQKKNYIDHWDEKTFTDFASSLVQQGVLNSVDDYMKTLPKGGFYLHFLPFLQGMLYVGNTTQLSDEDINLLQSVADAFATAYARYEDFNKLEAAKKQVDSTLTELQSTQKQLIQSEKMASLGELTAGIAHEIQNPLNFVNNFSEVSTELVDEMNEEITKGNLVDAKEIANDLKQNLEKINHHGKRAGDIVKGMLQHSRKSEGKKELTDINALCDEYLRLSYHGLRAKDKSFNAKFESDFDASLPKINVVPQDIGRVILNLINNAFYAASLNPPLGGRGAVPTVWVGTSKIPPLGGGGADKVLVSVKDNGPGIPDAIKDKIFQPFFTTKPTGSGTGLGLSLSYDIVKAHGGEIKVETKEGVGTEFIIQLPVV